MFSDFIKNIEEYLLREQIEEEKNQNSEIIYSSESNYDISKWNNSENCNYFDKTDCTLKNSKYKNIKIINDNDNQNDKNDPNGFNLEENKKQNTNNQFDSNNDWFYDQFGRSIEYVKSNEESQESFSSQVLERSSVTLGWNIVKKIADLDKIISEKYILNINLLDIENPLFIKNSVIKVNKHNFLKFQNAEMQNLEKGNLEYLSINLVNDSVYVECTFDKLSTNGIFKTNLLHTKLGSFSIDLNNISSSISTSFHKGKRNIRPAKSSIITAYFNTDNHQNVDALNKAINKKYRHILENSISAELYNSTYKGMVDRLKTELKNPLNNDNNERATKLYDMNWTEDNLNIQMSNIGGQSWKQVNQKMDSMSYTRKTNTTYKLRFDVNLKELKWISDLTVILNGKRSRVQSLEFGIKDIRFHITIFKSIDNRNCQKIQIAIHVNDLQYNLNEQLESSIKSSIKNKLHGFIERSFKEYMKNALKQEVCNNRLY